MNQALLIVHVHIKVKPDRILDFKKATIENARNSVAEPGIERFELVQSQSDPSSFILMEIYRSSDDQASHKKTEHFLQWHETVDSMMAEPRRAEAFERLYPVDV